MFDIVRRKKRYDIETLSIYRVLNKKKTLQKNHAENVRQKLFSGSFFNFVNKPKQPLHARNPLKNKYFEGGLSKSHKKVTFIFSLEPSTS